MSKCMSPVKTLLVILLTGSVGVHAQANSASQKQHAAQVPTQSGVADGKVTDAPPAFSDDPKFAVAGVTDWTAVGGHGSDATLRTSEDLARETQSLQAQRLASADATSKQVEAQLRAAHAANPASYEATRSLGEYYLQVRRFREALALLESASAMHHQPAREEYLLALACRGVGDAPKAREHVRRSISLQETADADRLAGEVDEQLGEPLRAVQQEERAAQLDPSEENYFAWGSELLLHRAVWQAAQVFSLGAAKYPGSARLLQGWGAALFADAMYSEAADKLCRAAGLHPEDAQVYLDMTKVAMAAPAPLPCVEQRLAERLHARPDDAAANYSYAMYLEKMHQGADQVEIEGLLRKAVLLRPDYAEAYLALGILSANKREYGQAIAYYAKAVQAEPALAEAHYRLGITYDHLGERARAQEELALHARLVQEQADAVERQRRQVKQFSVAAQAQTPGAPKK